MCAAEPEDGDQMKTVGIVCEYNPFHRGHYDQLVRLRAILGSETAVVCVMSGEFVQRGEPAVMDKLLRARAAVDCGVNLVLQLPAAVCLRSAEGFAEGAVELLDRLGVCDYLCFGCECGSIEPLNRLADCLQSAAFSIRLREYLGLGLGFAAARQRAVEDLCGLGDLLLGPNNILAVEYCKALRRLNSSMQPMPLHRPGDYRSQTADAQAPSATAVRRLLLADDAAWREMVPEQTAELYQSAALYDLQSGQRAMLARLRLLEPEAWHNAAHCGEGLENRVRRAVLQQPTLEAAIRAAGTRRYPTARLRRLMLCACLDMDRRTLNCRTEYGRVLAFDDPGRELLRLAGRRLPLVHVGREAPKEQDRQLEHRVAMFYSLFCRELERSNPNEADRRIYYRRENKNRSLE